MSNKVTLGHLSISPGSLSDLVAVAEGAIGSGNQLNCIPINVTKYGLSKRHPRLAAAINESELVIADGMPIRWLASIAGLANVHRVTGIEFAEAILRTATLRQWRVFLFGASPESLAGAVAAHRSNYPGIRIVGSRNGYYDDHEVSTVIDEINACEPEVVLFGLGLPQKEYFIADHKDRLSSKINIAVGGAFDVWAGEKKRAPRLFQSLGLEWFYRSFSNYQKSTTLARNASVFFADLFAAVVPRSAANRRV